MLKRFEVIGYKNFRERFILDFSNTRDYQYNMECIREGLINTAIIYGKNAVGKTNFGRAVLDVRKNVIVMNNDANYLNADMETNTVEFKYVFVFDGKEVEYIYEKNDQGHLMHEKLFIQHKLIFDYDHIEKSLVDESLELVGAQTLNWEFTNHTHSIFSYIVNNTSLSDHHPLRKTHQFILGMSMIQGNLLLSKSAKLERIIKDIIDEDMVEDFEIFLNKYGIDEKLIVVNTSIGDKILCFYHKKPISFIQNCSSGTASLVRLYSWIKKVENATFLYLDEFDAFYHYELSEKVIETIKGIQTCQTILTSHNTDLLSNKLMRPDCFFILTKEKMSSFADATARELREGHNLEKLFKSGEFNE